MSAPAPCCPVETAEIPEHLRTPAPRPARGEASGGRFFVLGRQVWARLHAAPTASRMSLYITFLVLLAGTGSDHRLTKWSAKACEHHVGLGKPRARRAIEELVAAGLVERVEGAARLHPQYRLPAVSAEEDPIFLPVQLVTGFGAETPVLRRVRETGDALLLRMLVDLYGLVEPDATGGIPIASLSLSHGPSPARPARKLAQAGVHALWATQPPDTWSAAGPWTHPHHAPGAELDGWQPFWDRITTLQQIGALWSEPWLFDAASPDAEPLLPVPPEETPHRPTPDAAEVAALWRLIHTAADAMTQDHPDPLADTDDTALLIPLHHQPCATSPACAWNRTPRAPGWRGRAGGSWWRRGRRLTGSWWRM